eukprot:m.164807 g.164807  ORF g.164807 m.164807 type:complete len:651 (-) comp12473_c0_seq1:341-2293(-)
MPATTPNAFARTRSARAGRTSPKHPALDPNRFSWPRARSVSLSMIPVPLSKVAHHVSTSSLNASKVHDTMDKDKTESIQRDAASDVPSRPSSSRGLFRSLSGRSSWGRRRRERSQSASSLKKGATTDDEHVRPPKKTSAVRKTRAKKTPHDTDQVPRAVVVEADVDNRPPSFVLDEDGEILPVRPMASDLLSLVAKCESEKPRVRPQAPKPSGKRTSRWWWRGRRTTKRGKARGGGQSDDGTSESHSRCDSEFDAACAMDDDMPGFPGLRHPCLTCYEREDNDGVYGMCFACGQLVCGGCVAAGRAAGACPACEEHPAAEPGIKFARLRALDTGRAPLAASAAGRRLPLAVARSNLARLYQSGVGTGKDPNPLEAARLYRLAAADGYGPAAFHLGCLLFSGAPNVPRDRPEALKLFALAERSGNALAQYNMGLLYTTGQGVKRDLHAAALLFELAASQGLPAAEMKLAELHERGDGGVEHDEARALALYTSAAASGSLEAQEHVARLELSLHSRRATDPLPLVSSAGGPHHSTPLQRAATDSVLATSTPTTQRRLAMRGHSSQAGAPSPLSFASSSPSSTSASTTSTAVTTTATGALVQGPVAASPHPREWAYQRTTLGHYERPKPRIRQSEVGAIGRFAYSYPVQTATV